MKTFFIFIMIVAVLYVLWILWQRIVKQKLNTAFEKHRQDLYRIVTDESDYDELPEKTKKRKWKLDRERKAKAQALAVQQKQELIYAVSLEDQNQFDNVAKWFFEQALQVRDRAEAELIQQDVLKKMPLSTHCQIGKFDHDEWAIYWHHYDQSLEYYVGRYGIFYTHVDKDGREHKLEFRI